MNIAIVGGGAAGLMAAASALKEHPEAEIFLIEKNDGLGKKVIISGGGRCNVTTGIMDVRTVLTRYPRGNKFLSSAMHQFSPQDVYAWFESHDVPLKIEEDLRVFPVSNNGKDIVEVFTRLFGTSSVHLLLRKQVMRITKEQDDFFLFLKDQTEPIQAQKVILTTGGQAYRHTGSTGDGYALAESLGHTVTPLAASLNGFFTRETWPKYLSGLSFEKATFTAERASHPSYTGPFLFTHKGVSGPAVFALSSLVAFEAYDAQQPLKISIDLFPDVTVPELKAMIEVKIAANSKKSFCNIFPGLIAKSLADVLCQELGVPFERHAGEVSKKEILQAAEWLKHVSLHVIGRGAGDEFVTAGGVDLHEVNPSTMESKICPGLFFAGEILDIDGFTGGFNLQASWATGRLAGKNAVG